MRKIGSIAAGVTFLIFGLFILSTGAAHADDHHIDFIHAPAPTYGVTDGEGGPTELDGPSSVATVTVGSKVYAVVGALNDRGVQIMNVTDPRFPIYTSSVTDGQDGYSELNGVQGVAATVIGSRVYAIAAAFTDDGIQIIDITDPYNPSPAAALTANSTLQLDAAAAVDTITIGSRHYALVAAYLDDALQIIDITNPTSPVATAAVVDNQGGFDLLDGARGVAAITIGSKHYAIVSAFFDDSVNMIDITNPSSPTLASTATEGRNGFHGLDAAWGITTATIGSKHYALAVGQTDDALQIIEITNPASPVPTAVAEQNQNGFTRLDQPRSVDTITVGQRTYAIVASSFQSHGVQIIDITNPASPSAVAAVTDDSVDSSSKFDKLYGAWGIKAVPFGEQNYAIVAATNDDGIQFINLTDPTSPKPSGSVADGSALFAALDRPNDVATVTINSRTYALVTAFDDDGLSIMDITVPSFPLEAGTIVRDTNTYAGFDGPSGVATFRSGSNTYALVSQHNNDTVSIMDISNPYRPSLTATVKEATEGNPGFDSLDGVQGIATFSSGNRVYAIVAASNSDSLAIIDVTNPASPAKTSEITDDAGGFTELAGAIDVSTAVIGSSTYALVAALDDDGVQIIDVTNPASPAAVAAVTDGQGGFAELDGPYHVTTFAQGSRTYALVAANADSGVQIIDITDPADPRPAAAVTDGSGGFDALGSVRDIMTVDNGTHTFALVTSSGDSGVQIIDVTDPRSPAAVAAVTDGSGGFDALAGAYGIANATIRNSTYAVVTSETDDGVQIINLDYDPPPPPPAPANLAVLYATHDSMTLAWDGAEAYRVTGAQIQRSTDGQTFATIVNDTGSPAPSYVDTGLTHSTQYHYRVAWWDAYGIGPHAEITRTTPAPPPPPPANLAVSAATPTSITLDWDDAAAADRVIGIQIHRSTGDGAFARIVNDTGSTASSYTDTGLTQLTDYRYRVAWWNGSGVGAHAGIAHTTPGIPPSAPTNLAVTASDHSSITLDWDDAPPADAVTGARIQRSLGGQAFATIVNDTGSSTSSYADTGLLQLATYHYRVAWWNASAVGPHAEITRTTSAEPARIGFISEPFPAAGITDGQGGFEELAGAFNVATAIINGRTYAVVAGNTDSGIQVINVTNPSSPVPTAAITDAGAFTNLVAPTGVATARIDQSTYALVSDYSGDAVYVINITDPARPTSVAVISDANNLRLQNVLHIETVEIGTKVYAVAGASSQQDSGVQVINITNPASPEPTAGIGVSGGVRGITTATIGTSTYVLAASQIGKVEIISMTNPSNLASVATVTDGQGGFTELGGAWGVTTVEIGTRTYAIITGNVDDGVQIIDITNPASPSPVAAIGHNATYPELDGAYGITTVSNGTGTYAIITGNVDDGVQIIDITNPASPGAVAAIADGTGGFAELDGARGIATFTTGGSTYAIVASQDDNGVQIIDLNFLYIYGENNEPLEDVAPTRGALDSIRTPDPLAAITDGTGGKTELDGARDIAIATVGTKSYAVVTGYDDDGVQIMNVTDPRFTSPLATIQNGTNYPELDGVSGVDTMSNGTTAYAIITSEEDDAVTIVNITDPASPVNLANITDNSTLALDGALDVAIATIGAKFYALVTAFEENGIQIFNITNPASPKAVTIVTDNENKLGGAWGIATVTIGSSHYALVTANTSGNVQVIDITDPARPELKGNLSDSGTLALDSPRGIVTAETGGRHYALVASEGDNGIQIIDITDPSSPAGVFSSPSDEFGALVNASGIATALIDSRHYALVASRGDDSVHVIDITDPENARQEYSVTDGSGGFSMLGGAGGIATVTSGGVTYALVAAGGDDGVQIMNVTGSASRLIMAIADSGVAAFDTLSGATDVAGYDNSTHTFALAVGSRDDGIQIIDITNPTFPVGAASIADGEGGFDRLAGAAGITVIANTTRAYALVASQTDDAVTIIEITDPYSPRLIASAARAPNESGHNFDTLDGAVDVATFSTATDTIAVVAAFGDSNLGGIQMINITTRQTQ